MDLDRVRIPASLNDEDVFLSYGPLKMSMRQLCVAAAGIVMWFGVAKYLLMPLFGFTMLPSMLATLWIPAIFLALAFVKIQQRPIDQWIGDKINFVFGTRTYILRDERNLQQGIDANLYSDEDVDAMLESIDRPRAY